MVSFPPCKINLGLQVIDKRPDGYHDLVTCFYPVPWTDILEIVPSQQLSFTATGNVIPGSPDDNLCLRAYHMLAADHKIPPVDIHLHKIIPTGAGLGGGSSDAAHTLRTLNSLFDLRLTYDQLAQYASRLGSDCAFFIGDEPMIGRGRGEILSSARDMSELKNTFLIIVKPEIHVSTAEAYAGITPRHPGKLVDSILDHEGFRSWKTLLKNDFEESVFEKYPQIGLIKDQLYQYGAVYASMSGSGAAVFGIFENPIDLKENFTDCVYWSGAMR